MPMLIGMLVVLAAMYQLFFRYDTWPDEKKPNVRYEHDNLTGATRILEPGAKVSVFARLLGSDGDSPEKGRFLEPMDADGDIKTTDEVSQNKPPSEPLDLASIDLKDHRQVEKIAKPVPVPREVVVASSAPPVPGGNVAPEDTGNPFAVRQIDLDQDGSSEEIIQNAGQSDGLLDISIVKNGREIFFGRGQQIALLPTRNRGWADIALKMGQKTLQVFRYDVRSAAYKAVENQQG